MGEAPVPGFRRMYQGATEKVEVFVQGNNRVAIA